MAKLKTYVNKHGQAMQRQVLLLPQPLLDQVRVQAIRHRTTAANILRQALAEGLTVVMAAEPPRQPVQFRKVVPRGQ